MVAHRSRRGTHHPRRAPTKNAPDDEAWRIDVLALFTVIDAVEGAARAITPPGKYATVHALWLDAVDDFVAAGRHLYTGVLDDNERALAAQASDRRQKRLGDLADLLPQRVCRSF